MHVFQKICVPLHPQIAPERFITRQNRDVAQLVAHYVRDVGVGRSSRLIPTKRKGANARSGCQSATTSFYFTTFLFMFAQSFLVLLYAQDVDVGTKIVLSCQYTIFFPFFI